MNIFGHLRLADIKESYEIKTIFRFLKSVKIMFIDISHIITQYQLPKDIEYKVEIVEAHSLLCPERLDLAAKYLYLELKDVCPNYSKELYNEHIRVMTKGSYIEPYSQKKNAESFIKSFNDVYDDLKNNGYSQSVSPIPVDQNYRIMDGAHRIAACIKLGIKVPVVILPMEAKDDIYDQAFFEKQGMNPDLLDVIVQCYIRLSNKCACINIWPSAKGHDKELFDIIKKEFKIIYKKDVPFNENGAFYYLAQIYQEYSWAQNSSEGFSGVYRKLMPCFPSFDPVRCVFVEVKDYAKLVDIKEEMRELYDLEKHSLHMTDNKKETIQMANILLSANTISFLNACNALEYKNTFKLLEQARNIQKKNDVCFTGSLVLALYGVRQANDVDYICSDDNDSDSHNAYLSLYGYSKGEILYQPNLSFSFFDLRFLNLKCIKSFKINRDEKKDRDDIKLIDFVLKNTGKSWKAEYLRKKRRIIAKIQGEIIRLAHKTGTYELLRQTYKHICKL